ncbi:MAG: hypothetical protein MJY63_01795 [Paludibacteraceae bacterium]|nr:hypothetical protein [Paludibacteraceae bacterium]
MNYIPAIYFTTLTVILFIKRGLDASSYLSLIYAATSIFAIGIDIMGLNPSLVECASLLPTILYCLLLTLFILPAILIDINSFDGILMSSLKFVRLFNFIFFFSFVCFIIAYYKDVQFVLSYGDFHELKKLVYEGDAYELTKYPGPVELILYPVRIIVSSSPTMLFIFFFNITFLKEKWWVNLMAILGSTTSIINGISQVDRSSTFFWVLILGLAVSTFWNQMSAKIKSVAISFSTILFIAVASYALSVTKDRFEDRDGGSQGGVVLYLGQPYYHFCEIWDYYPAPDGITTKSLFPALHKFVLKDFNGTVSYQQEMGLKSNMDLGVFYTHLGSFILSAGNFGPFMITTLYLLIFYFFFKEDDKYKTSNNANYLDFKKAMMMFILLSIPAVGCICYYYENYYLEAYTYIQIAALYTLTDEEPQILHIRKHN